MARRAIGKFRHLPQATPEAVMLPYAMRFDLVDLRLFVHVHEAGTITGGAARSHMTLASASERIRGMEEAIGVPLLVRDRRGVALAPAGRTLARHARLVLQQVDALGGEMARHGKGLAGTIRI